MKSFDDWAREITDHIREKAVPTRKIEPEEGGPCLFKDCAGTHSLQYDDDLGGCSCFKSPPCSYCLSAKLVCDVCGSEP